MTERSLRMALDHQVHRWRNRSRRLGNRFDELKWWQAKSRLSLPFWQVIRAVMIRAMTNAAAQIDSSVTLLADYLTNQDSHVLFQLA
jgi:hypothetical protein